MLGGHVVVSLLYLRALAPWWLFLFPLSIFKTPVLLTMSGVRCSSCYTERRKQIDFRARKVMRPMRKRQ